jgi:hypothetical protein
MTGDKSPNWPLHTDKRVAVVWACAQKSRGLAEVSRETALSTGELAGLLKRMVRDGALEADGEPGRRGTLYRLVDGVRPLLERPAAVATRPEAGLRVVLARNVSGTQFADLLRRQPDLVQEASWVVRGDGAAWLFAFSGDVRVLTLDRLAAALEQAGAACERHSFDAVMTVPDLHRYLVAIRDAVEQTAQ